MDNGIENLINELRELDKELIQIDGNFLKASQCYHLETDPLHMLFNTNCPDSLKEKIQMILARYLPSYENSTSQ